MTVRMSYDEARTWPVTWEIYSVPSGYSCLTILTDRSIGYLYECGETRSYDKIAFTLSAIQWLTDEADYIH